MSVEAALFFESVEEIYARVFRDFRSRASVPTVQVRFRKYANLNSRIKLSNGLLTVDISDLLEPAPAPIQEALAMILISKLLRKQPDQSALARYRRYLERGDVRRALHRAKQERGRKEIREPQGETYNLVEIFELLNLQYFHGLMSRPTLGWSLRPSRTTLGHYDPSHHTIVLSCLLDQPSAPRLVVDYVMFHEMLHLRFPTQKRGQRRCVHTPEFKAAEKAFEGFSQARSDLRSFMDQVRADWHR